MKRHLVRAALAAGLIATVAGGLPESSEERPATHLHVVAARKASRGPCNDIDWERGPGAVRVLIRCLWERFEPGHGDASTAIAIASCESTLRPDAVGNGNLGLFQHRERYWPDRFANLVEAFPLRRAWRLSSSAFDARTNAIVTAIYVRRYGWSAWACA